MDNPNPRREVDRLNVVDQSASSGQRRPEFPLSIFVGPGGLRAGWRLLAFVSMALVLGRIFFRLLSAFSLAGSASLMPARWLVQQVALVGAVLVPARILAGLEGRSLADYGLPLREAFGSRFWQGALWGFLALTAVLELMHVSHAFDFGQVGIHGQTILVSAVAWAAVFLLVGIFEEFATRGYALFTLTTGMGFWPAAVLLSAAFGALHLRNGGEDRVGALAAALIGLFWCLTVRHTGNLWFAIGMHASWDYAESFIYGVPDSGATLPGHLLNPSFHGPTWLTGGSVGPEGSVLAFAAIGIMFLVFSRFYRDVRFPRADGGWTPYPARESEPLISTGSAPPS